jgi:small subunit ribosomal protein S2
MVDTNSDPREVEFVIPSNDDASKSIDKILSLVTAAIVEGLSDRGSDKEADATEKRLRRQKSSSVATETAAQCSTETAACQNSKFQQLKNE